MNQPHDSPDLAAHRPSSPTAKPWEHAQAGGSGGDPLAARFVASLDYDTRLYRQDIAGSRIHASMLAEVGLITPEQRDAIDRGLTEIEREIESQGAAWSGWRIDLEDVHMCVEAALVEKVGDAGRALHTGRSRNDQVALDLKLWIRDATVELRTSIDTALRSLLELAERDGSIVMPAYTHLQRAQPIVVAGELVAWMAMLDRAGRRVEALREVDGENPLGSGAVAGSGLPLDRAFTSERLGLGGPTGSSLDATATRDAAIDFVYGLTMIAQVLSRLAEQWILYCSTEFGFVKLDPTYTTGSSMMPQKQNPDMLELIRGRCATVYGHHVALLTMVKGLPLAYNRDLQEDKRHVFAAFDHMQDCLAIAAGLIRTASFRGEAIESTLDRGFLDATSLADYLVDRGVPFRTAHQVVGGLVRRCTETGRDRLEELSLEEIQAGCDAAGVSLAVDRSIYDWLGAAKVAARYRSHGNAGAAGASEQLKRWRERLHGAGASRA